ncbi:MAG: cytochrome c nitrite reductase small subunit [Candidatus Cloacimonas sp. 4484_143]|nr:MAG: cytochrome c nitrite reductase small subunit [Candidatus Cloacimonas sp. 4484_143]RLC57548.1 MAG: cytochrome c nitrite reductase small subunit [Candidatus Cloacimonadota bacterium]
MFSIKGKNMNGKTVILPIVAGIIVGLGFFILYVFNFTSYASEEPETCMNCHVMSTQYASWTHSSHFGEANCIDCHLPHDNFVHKLYFKANDGLRHSFIFLTRTEPEAIMIKKGGAVVVQENCIRCHKDVVTQIGGMLQGVENRKCWDCHRFTPHGRERSLSSVPNAEVPYINSATPMWLRKILEKK